MGFQIIGEDKPLTWEEFEEYVKQDIEEVKRKRLDDNLSYYSDWIYRGQSKSSWNLETSLERYLRIEFDENKQHYPVNDYYLLIENIIPAINSLSKKNFNRFRNEEIKFRRMSSLPKYELLCYLRHLGFPSPMLDWSKSHYVAACFAFKHAIKGNNVSIYTYQEWNGDARGGSIDKPIWNQQGFYVETHERHYRQQSDYTVCCAKIDDEIVFTDHEKAANEDHENHNLKKYILSWEEKDKVLEMLFKMNINDYTLFGDDESLMRMLAFKEFRNL